MLGENILEIYMNDIIRDLLEQAGVKYSILPKDTVYAKFAELIVQECIRCCDDVDTIQKHYEKYHLDMELGADQCIEVIKKHFGIES